MESRDYEGTSEPMDDGDVSGLGNLQQVRALTPEGGARTWTEGRNTSPWWASDLISALVASFVNWEKSLSPGPFAAQASGWYTLATVINDSVPPPSVSDWGLTIHFKLHLHGAFLSYVILFRASN